MNLPKNMSPVFFSSQIAPDPVQFNHSWVGKNPNQTFAFTPVKDSDMFSNHLNLSVLHQKKWDVPDANNCIDAYSYPSTMRTRAHPKYLNLRFEVEAKADNDGVTASAAL